MRRAALGTLLLVVGASALKVPLLSRREAIGLAAFAVPGAASAYGSGVSMTTRSPTAGSGPSGPSLSDLLDDAVSSEDELLSRTPAKSKPDRGIKSTADQAEAMRASLAKEASMKEARAQVAIARMDEMDKIKERANERAKASGLAPCKEGVWGSGQSGLLQAEACYRERDGFVDSKKTSGFMVVF